MKKLTGDCCADVVGEPKRRTATAESTIVLGIAVPPRGVGFSRLAIKPGCRLHFFPLRRKGRQLQGRQLLRRISPSSRPIHDSRRDSAAVMSTPWGLGVIAAAGDDCAIDGLAVGVVSEGGCNHFFSDLLIELRATWGAHR